MKYSHYFIFIGTKCTSTCTCGVFEKIIFTRKTPIVLFLYSLIKLFMFNDQQNEALQFLRLPYLNAITGLLSKAESYIRHLIW